MKLYKYVTMASALKIIESRTIAFSHPKDFNDPFDQPRLPNEESARGFFRLLVPLRAKLEASMWGDSAAALCLTRTATNPLMWAHYADCHRGVVIGIDTQLAGFLDTTTNLVPAHFGNIVYSSVRNTSRFHSNFEEPAEIGSTHHFVLNHQEKWQRMFLSKPLSWAYEEEVRVVKCVNGIDSVTGCNSSGKWTIIQDKERKLYCLHIPIQAITDVILGARVSSFDVLPFSRHVHSTLFKRAELDDSTYTISVVPFDKPRYPLRQFLPEEKVLNELGLSLSDEQSSDHEAP